MVGDPVNLMLLRDWHDFSIVAREGTGYLNGRVIRQEMPLQYGDVIDLNRENIDGFDVREFYVQLVSSLRERGY